MLPLLHDKDIVYYQPLKLGFLQIDDLVTVKKGPLFFTHRVIYISPKKNKSFVITKGDNNVKIDGFTMEKNILGKVIKVKRNGKIFDPRHLYLLQSSFYLSEIILLTKTFAKNRIDYVILKGLPLHLHFEKTHPKRLYADCDILIAKKDVVKAQKILQELGYKTKDTSFSPIHRLLKTKETEKTYEKTVSQWKIFLDIHEEAVFLMTQLGKLNALYPKRLVDAFTEELLREKTYIRLHGQKIPILFKENLFIYLALHIFHHNFKGYQRYHLLHNIIKKQKIDFKEVVKKIQKYNMANFVFPVYFFLKKYYESPIPDMFLRQIKPHAKTERYIKRNIFPTNILEGELRLQSGIDRFRHIFFLSPNPLRKKILAFLEPQVIYSVLWALKKKVETKKLFQ